MTDGLGEMCIVFNGEIYNYRELRSELIGRGHRFFSTSDTEVILASYREWGTACLSHLNGMFAFAVYDISKNLVFLSRDRAGEKPLFYTFSDGVLRFASELKGLMADKTLKRRLNAEAFDCYLAMGFVPAGRCILEGVNKLPPAHALLFDLDRNTSRTWRYWSLPRLETLAENDHADDAALVDELDTLLADAVKRQLVADVPVGVLLSGGVDSSLVTAMAVRASPNVKTFTITFPGHGSYDEGPYAKMVARHFGTQHTELVGEPATIGLLPELARQYDEPLGDSSMVPTYLVSRLVRGGCTVALGGDAGDELFGGYTYYSRIQEQLRWRKLIPRPLKRLIGEAAAFLPTGLRGRTYLRSLAVPDGNAWVAATLHFDVKTRRRLAPLTGDLRYGVPETERFDAGGTGNTILQKMTAADFNTYLPEDILAKVDRASMLTSLEVRAPFLDYRIIEFAFSKVPDRLRATRSDRKVLLKMLAKRLLPAELDIRRKQGFSLPLDSWFKGEWGSYLADVLRSAPTELYDPKAIEALITGQKLGFGNAQRLFNLAILELWRREYDVRIS